MSNTNMSEKYLWVEKYRPRKVEDLVIEDNFKKSFDKFLREKEIPHLFSMGLPDQVKQLWPEF